MSLYYTITNLIFHPNKKVRTLITSLYFAAGIIVNFFVFQVFCVPVWWAALIFILSLTGLLLFPFFSKKPLRKILSFSLGLGIPVSIYCIFFLGGILLLQYISYLFAILFLGAGLLAFIPFYHLYHIFKYYKTTEKANKKYILAGAGTPVLSFIIYFIIQSPNYKQLQDYLSNTNTYSPEIADKLPVSEITEKVIGTGFKYHTFLEYIYDGWRPPLHDPFYNTFILLHYTYYPFYNIKLEDRVKFYRHLFPEKSITVSCPCSYTYDGKSYFRDKLFK